MRKKCKIFLTILIATLAISPKTYAQAITAEQGVCIGEKLAGYVAGVKGAALGCPIAGTGDLGGLGAFTMWAGLSSEAEQYLRSRAELVVLYNNFAPASQIAGRTVGRFLGEVNITDSQVNSIYGQIQSQIASNGSVNVWQGYNEPRSQGTPWDKIAEHDIQVIKATKDGGKSACVGNFKETVTSIDSSYKDAIIRELTAHGGRAYLCLHSHWNSEASLNSEIARVNSLGNFMGLSVLVTVAGYDTAAGAAAASGAGWVGNIDAATYKDQLLRFKSGTNNSGVAIFAMGMGGSWSSFDPTPLLSVAAAQAPGGCTPTPLQHIKLLSPAFNMTNLHSAGIVGSMLTTNPSVFNGLDGIAGNSYNVGYGTATGLVTDWFNKTGLHHLPVMITETGTTSGDWAFLRPELDCMQNVSCGGIQYLGASLFDLLGDGSRTWNGISFAYTGSDLIGEVCGGNCTNLGNNLAGSVSGDGSTTAGYGLTYEVGIVDGRDPSGPAGYINNLAPGVIPILRVGTALMRVGDGPSATEYGTFIKQLDSMINREVYIVAGPNEPQSECWWETSGECYGPDCGAVSDVEKVPRTIIGKITSSKVEKDAITGSTETSKPVEGTTVCVYQGAAGDKLPYYIPNFEAGGTTDENGRTSFVSSNVERIYGFTAREIRERGAELWLAGFTRTTSKE